MVFISLVTELPKMLTINNVIVQIYSARPTAENHFINTDWG